MGAPAGTFYAGGAACASKQANCLIQKPREYHGMSYERMHGRNFVAEHKAAYLSRIGRQKESLRLYEELRLRPSLTEEEKYRIAYNIELLRQQAI